MYFSNMEVDAKIIICPVVETKRKSRKIPKTIGICSGCRTYVVLVRSMVYFIV